MPVTSFFSGPPPAIPTCVSEFFKAKTEIRTLESEAVGGISLSVTELNFDSPKTFCTSLAKFYAQTVRKAELCDYLLRGQAIPIVINARSLEEYNEKRDEIMDFAIFFGRSGAIAGFSSASLQALYNFMKNAFKFNPAEVDYLNSLLRRSFKMVSTSTGFNADYSRFHLDFIYQAYSNIFPGERVELSHVSSEIIAHKETLLNVNMCTYGEGELSEKATEFVLRISANLERLQILNLEGYIIMPKHLDLLKNILSKNLEIRELHLTKSKLKGVDQDDLCCLTDRSLKFVLHTSDPKPPLDVAFDLKYNVH